MTIIDTTDLETTDESAETGPLLERRISTIADIETALDEFLRDPIGYAEYDVDDPITLAEFIGARHQRGVFAAPLAF